MVYSQEVQAKIKDLEAQIKELKETGVVIPGRNDMDELGHLTGSYGHHFHSHISWLARASVCGIIESDNFSSTRTKKLSDMTTEEATGVANCMNDVMDVLLKYARQIKRSGENR